MNVEVMTRTGSQYSRSRGLSRWGVAAMVLLLGAACVEEEIVVPTEEEAAAIFSEQRVEVELRGNVVVLTAVQSTSQLRRGGELWAKVGPYIYLFTGEVQELLTTYNGVGGVRVTTETPGGTQIASVLLPRDALNDITWKRALNISGLARTEGSTRITRLTDLVDWGEEHTEYEYNSRWVGQ